MENKLKRLLTATQVAPLLKVREARVYELARLGIIPSVRLGRQVRFDPDQIAGWILAGGRGLSDDRRGELGS